MHGDESMANRIVPGWIVVRQPNGTLLMRQTAEARKRGSAGCLIFTVLWNGMVLSFLAQALGLVPANWDAGESSPRPVLLGGLALFGIIGLCGIYSVTGTLFGYQEWIAGPNYLEMRWGWTFSRKTKSRRYVDGNLTVSHATDREDGASTGLSFECPGGWMNQGLLLGTRGSEATAAHVGELAELVAQATGWPLTVTGTPAAEGETGS